MLARLQPENRRMHRSTHPTSSGTGRSGSISSRWQAPHLPEVGDSAVVAQYTGIWVDGGPEFNALDVFWPSFCGPFIGVRVALSLLGGDEGNMNVSVMALNLEGTGLGAPLIVDLAPDSMAFNLNYGGLFTPPLRAATVLGPALRRVIYRRLLPYLIQR